MPKSQKSARVDDRKVMNAIFYVLRTGAATGGRIVSLGGSNGHRPHPPIEKTGFE
jgi:transposase